MNEKFHNVLVVKMGLAIFIFSTGPLVVMCTITVAIVAKLVLNRKKGKQKVAALTGTMVTVNAAFFVTTLPFTIHVLTFKSMKPNQNTPQEVANYEIFYAIAVLCYCCNNCCNFFLYVLVSRRFRSELKLLFSHCHNKIGNYNTENPVISTSTNNTVESH